MSIVYIIIFGTITAFSISAVGVFLWAIQSGQFSDFRQGATSIFDEDEPIGEMTDFFPGQRPQKTGAASDVSPSTKSDGGNRDVDNHE